MNKVKFIICLAVLPSLLIYPSSIFAAVLDYSVNISFLIDYLENNQDTDGKITGFGGETSWTIMGMVASGVDPATIENSGNSLLDYLAANPPGDTATTGWERDLLAITAAGENPFTFGDRNYVDKVQSFANNSQIGSTTTLNDDIFGVLALISSGPSADQVIISNSIDFLIANQNADNGWSWQVGGASDSNDTAVAVQALKAADKAGFTNSGLTNAINAGVSYLLSLQQPDGGWEYQASFGTDGASTSWVIQAILGNDNQVENGLNFLASLQDTSGGVQYQSGFGADTFTSGYALSAFAQKPFLIEIFQESHDDPDDPPDQDDQDSANPGNNPPPTSDDGGKVLAATDSGDDGQVLATTLPDTGTSYAPSAIDLGILAGSPKDDHLRFFGSFLALGSGLMLMGVSIRYFNNRIKNYIIN